MSPNVLRRLMRVRHEMRADGHAQLRRTQRSGIVPRRVARVQPGPHWRVMPLDTWA